jgi:RNA polymerase sigma-54 factor
MALSQKLEMRQSHALVMTPKLQQAIKLLQLTNLELVPYLEQEVEQNPLLEHADTAAFQHGDSYSTNRDSGSEGSEGSLHESFDDSDAVVLDVAQLSEAETFTDTADAPLDMNYEEVFEIDAASNQYNTATVFTKPSSNARYNDFDENSAGLKQPLNQEISLKEHLLNQLGVDIDDPVDRIIGMHIIDTVDEAGYIVGDLDGIGEMVGCSRERVEATLRVLQMFDPPGVLARDLGECLTAQLRELDRLDPSIQCFLDNLDLLARHDYLSLAKLCEVDTEEIMEMAKEIRALNPKPGLLFGSEAVQPVVPDVFVHPTSNGEWQIELNNDTLPSVLVNMHYYAEISDQAKSQKEKEYLSERLGSARWLVKSLNQRADTILRVATELVRQQDKFLVFGIQYLRPLILRDIASVIEMHESTVSRVTINKYISTPRGIFPMKYFFDSALSSSSGGEAHSTESVRHRIQDLINNEQLESVLSDDKIVDILNSSGVNIARRTVAKYREAMRIPSSVERRRQKRVAGQGVLAGTTGPQLTGSDP